MRNRPYDDENNNSLVTVLTGVNITVNKGELLSIVGSTGSGKSSLLAGLLGECICTKGSLFLSPNTSIAFVPQSAWIQNNSLRENILFGSKYDEERYNQVLQACTLDQVSFFLCLFLFICFID
jgi:ABC-type multidrug transport system fused ATPase/permease subunit